MPSLHALTRRAVEAAIEEFVQIGRRAFLAKYGFGPARSFFVVVGPDRKLCDSKAIAGVAFRSVSGRGEPLKAGEFSGGEATVAAALGRLGFDVVAVRRNQATHQLDWTPFELDLIVSDYLARLQFELNGQKFNNSYRQNALVTTLAGRTKADVVATQRNISAVLLELGYPHLRTFPPMRCADAEALAQEIEKKWLSTPTLDADARRTVEQGANKPDKLDFEVVMTPRPLVSGPNLSASELRPGQNRFVPQRRDYMQQEARNRSLGQAGEEFIVDYERWRLAKAGADDLAKKVRHIAKELGDGLGYDVLSFDQRDGSEVFVEVKTTNYSDVTPFFVTSREASFSKVNSSQFSLYRVFDFRSRPRFFALRGSIESNCRLEPATFRATLIA